MTEKKQINLLSLDFDYFQQMEDKFILAEYPDGNDLSHDISEVIWSLHYRNKKAYDKLMSVKLNKKEFHLACSILQNQKREHSEHDSLQPCSYVLFYRKIPHAVSTG